MRNGSIACDAIEEGTQACAAAGVDLLYVGNAAAEMCAEVGVVVSVLCFQPVTRAVCQDGFESVVAPAVDVEMVVHD